MSSKLKLPLFHCEELRSQKEILVADYSETREKEFDGKRRERIEVELVILTENEIKQLLQAAQTQLKVIWLRFKNGNAVSGYVQLESGGALINVTSISDTVKTAYLYKDLISITCSV